MKTRVLTAGIVTALALIFFLIVFSVNFLTRYNTPPWFPGLIIFLIISLAVTAFFLFRALDSHLDKTETSGSRFGRDFKGDFKSSPGPYGQGLKAIGGKTLTNND